MANREGRLTDYGMGWRVSPWYGHFQVAHSGSQPETRTYIRILPTIKFAVAIASNLEGLDLNPYIRRLTELILNEDIDSRPYASTREMGTMLSACSNIFSYGLSYYDWKNAPLTEDENQLKEAFAFFNKHMDINALKRSFKETKKKIDSGIHPSSKQAFTKIGSFMAAKLIEAYGEETLKKYQNQGLFRFFNDFITISRNWPAHKKAFTFSGKFNKLFFQWQRDWEKTYTDYVRNLVILPQLDYKEMETRLKKTFSNAHVYPNFDREMTDIGHKLLLRDELDRTFEIFTTCNTLYPDSPEFLSHLAFAHLWQGNIDTARNLFKKAFGINPDHRRVRPNWFRRLGELLEERAKSKALLALASTALELYPANAELHKDFGDYCIKAGQEKEAINYYRKAISLGLDFSELETILEQLKKSKK
jgi:tetratricopeptide (TPR) repeat protein